MATMSPAMRRELIVISAKKIYGDPDDTRVRNEWKRVFYTLLFDGSWKHIEGSK